GIRDDLVTGVQTCALPICRCSCTASSPRPAPEVRCRNPSQDGPASCNPFLGPYLGPRKRGTPMSGHPILPAERITLPLLPLRDRSEERRVGKGGECGWAG